MEKQKSEISIQISEIEPFANKLDRNQLIQIKNELTEIIINNVEDNFQYQKIFDNISSIISLINEIFNKKIQRLIEQYESIMKRDEQTIRILYKNLLTYKLLKDSLDNRIRLLLIKEKEYELVKDKTGAFFKNGEIVYNKQKDNEIIILRTENSNLKNIVENYEKIINDKDSLYEIVKNKYNILLNKLYKNKAKKLSIPNININLNDSPNINNNACHYSINLNNSKKVLNSSDKKNKKHLNYIKYKNISKINKINPFNNSISSKNMFQNSIFDLSPKDIFGIKNNINKSKNKEKQKKINLETQKDIKDICSLKKKNIKMEETFHKHYKKNQFNLLQAYTANSSNSLNKSPPSKKLSTYSNDPKISSYHTKNNYSQKINNNNIQNKINKGSIDNEQLYKSYISSIPIKKKSKENYSLVKKEKSNSKKYQLIYCKTKRENNTKKLYNKNKYYKKFNNIDINKIFLPSNLKKNSSKNTIK